jgi:hypothetical protein
MNTDLANPFHYKAGEKAYKAIMSFLRKHKLTNTGGCRAFYTPEEWKTRGEMHGGGAVLIVAHDGGDLAPVFNPNYGSSLFGKMDAHLEDHGFYTVGLTSWATAICVPERWESLV